MSAGTASSSADAASDAGAASSTADAGAATRIPEGALRVPTNRALAWAMVAIALGTAVWCALGAGLRATYGARTTADEPQYLMTALSIGEDLSLDVSDERAAGRYRAFHEVGLPLQEEVRSDGSRVSPHDPLLPALLAVPVVAGGWLAAKLALALAGGALAAAMVWVAVRRFGVGLGVACASVLVFSLAAPLAVYSTQVYPEIVAALAVTVGLGALTGPLRRTGLVTLAVTVVALPWLSVKYAPIATVLAVAGVVQLLRRDDRRVALGWLGFLATAAVVFLGLHQAWYGGFTPYASGHHFAGGEATVMGRDPAYLARSVRVLGLLVDRGFGLAAWAPAFLLAIPAFSALVRRRPPGWGALAAVLAIGWANATFVALTMHGWWWPGRQVVVVVPCVVLGVAWWAQQVPWARVVVVAAGLLGVITVAWVAVDALSGHMTLVVDFERTTNPWYRAWRHLLPDGRSADFATLVARAVWTALAAALAVAGWRSVAARPASPFARPSPRPPGRPCPSRPAPPPAGGSLTSRPDSEELACASAR